MKDLSSKFKVEVIGKRLNIQKAGIGGRSKP